MGEAPISEHELTRLHSWIGAARLRSHALAGDIPYLRGARGSRWYLPEHIEAIIRFFETPCPAPDAAPYSRSQASGFQRSRGEPASGGIGMTPQLRESAALLLASKI